MTLLVEDGSKVVGAESYATVVQADTRLAALGYVQWAPVLTVEKEQALRRSTRAMVQIWRNLWKGYRTFTDQALDFPRENVYIDQDGGGYYLADNVVPELVVNCCIDLAIKAAAGDLIPDTKGPRLIRQKLGPLEREWSGTGSQSTTFRAAWLMLTPLLNVDAGQTRVIR